MKPKNCQDFKNSNLDILPLSLEKQGRINQRIESAKQSDELRSVETQSQRKKRYETFFKWTGKKIKVDTKKSLNHAPLFESIAQIDQFNSNGSLNSNQEVFEESLNEEQIKKNPKIGHKKLLGSTVSQHSQRPLQIKVVADIMENDGRNPIEKGVYFIYGLSPRSLKNCIITQDRKIREVGSKLNAGVKQLTDAYDQNFLPQDEINRQIEKRKIFNLCLEDAKKIGEYQNLPLYKHLGRCYPYFPSQKQAAEPNENYDSDSSQFSDKDTTPDVGKRSPENRSKSPRNSLDEAIWLDESSCEQSENKLNANILESNEEEQEFDISEKFLMKDEQKKIGKSICDVFSFKKNTKNLTQLMKKQRIRLQKTKKLCYHKANGRIC